MKGRETERRLIFVARRFGLQEATVREGPSPWLQRGGPRGCCRLGVSATLINVSQHEEPVSAASIMHPGCLFAHREESEKRQHMSGVGVRPGKK